MFRSGSPEWMDKDLFVPVSIKKEATHSKFDAAGFLVGSPHVRIGNLFILFVLLTVLQLHYQQKRDLGVSRYVALLVLSAPLNGALSI